MMGENVLTDVLDVLRGGFEIPTDNQEENLVWLSLYRWHGDRLWKMLTQDRRRVFSLVSYQAGTLHERFGDIVVPMPLKFIKSFHNRRFYVVAPRTRDVIWLRQGSYQGPLKPFWPVERRIRSAMLRGFMRSEVDRGVDFEGLTVLRRVRGRTLKGLLTNC